MSAPVEITIRLARPQEREALEALQWRASLANDGDRQNLTDHPDAIHLPMDQVERGEILVAEVAGNMAGFSAVLEEGCHLELDGLFVEPAMWRQGVGAALVKDAAHRARLRGVALMVTANPAARDFYDKCGFVVEGQAQTRFGPAFRMSR